MGIEAFFSALRSRSFPLVFPGHYVNGEWINDPKSEVLQGSFNPSRAEPIVKVLVSKKIVEASIDSADSVQKTLEQTTLEQRLDYLNQLRQVLADYQTDIVEALCVEAGKPRWEAQADFRASLHQLDAIFSQRATIGATLLGPLKLGWTEAEFQLRSNGITLTFLPFSTPLATFIQSLAGSLIAGSPLIVMPSSHAVLSGVLLAYVMEKVELPRGSVNIVFGNYQTFTKALMDKRIQAVIYSGSREHCDAIRRDSSNTITRTLLLQSGGKNAVIVDRSADVKEAIRCILYGVIKNAGQLNTSTSRAYVHESMLQEFKAEMIKSVRGLKIGPTDTEADPHLGPLYAQKAVDKFLRYQTMAKREAADTWVWGKVESSAGADGYFVSPGVHFFDELETTTTSSYQSNVLMCPDLSVYLYKDLDQAIAASNATEAPLVTSLIGDSTKLKGCIQDIKAPNVLINLPTVGLDVFLPVAGRKLCGDYRLNGLGIALLLTYPQACKVAHLDRRDFEGWPNID